VEPLILRRGRVFHHKVQADWKRTAKDGHLHIEHSINLRSQTRPGRHLRRGRLDIFVDELGSLVSVIEIKSTNWDRISVGRVGSLLSSHRRQVWKYVERYVDYWRKDVSPGIIYPASPRTKGLREVIERYLNAYGIQVVWYNEA